MDVVSLAIALKAGKMTQEEYTAAVNDWLTAHPEATTTVQDGSITREKLDADLQQKTDEVGELKSALDAFDITATATDVGKALKAKIVSNGKVTEYELGDAAVIDPTLSVSGEAADAKATGDAISTLQSAITGMTTATASDEGKALKAKTVSGGKVTEWEFGEAGGGAEADLALAQIPAEIVTPVAGTDYSIVDQSRWIISNGEAITESETLVLKTRSTPVAIQPNDIIKMTFLTRGDSNYKAIIICGSDMGVLQSFDVQTETSDNETFEFIAPEDAAFVVWNQYNRSAPSVFTIKRYLEIAKESDLEATTDRVKAIEDWDSQVIISTSETANILDYNKIREGAIDASTGVFTPQSNTYKYHIVGPQYVKEGATYYLGSGESYIRGYYYYKPDGTYLSGWTGANNQDYVQQFTVPSGAMYVCLRFYDGKWTGTDEELKAAYKASVHVEEYGYTKQTFVPCEKLGNNYRNEFVFDTRYLSGKTVAILGDSIGTRQGYNTPEILIGADDVGVELSAYVTYNDVQAGLSIAGHTYTTDEIGTEVTFTPTADDIGKSIGVPLNHGSADGVKWWQMLIEKMGMNWVNASWSGASMVSYESLAEHGQYDCSCAWFIPTIRRCGIRTPGTMTRTAPDYIFVHRGVNDFSLAHAGSVTVLTDDTFSAYNYAIPNTDQVTISGQTRYDFKQAYAMTIQKLRDVYPMAKIICCTIAPFARNSETHFPPNNGIYNLPAFNSAIREVAAFFGCPVCEFAEAYTFERLSFFTGDGTHPNAYGHRAMYEKALIALANNMQFNG